MRIKGYLVAEHARTSLSIKGLLPSWESHASASSAEASKRPAPPT